MKMKLSEIFNRYNNITGMANGHVDHTALLNRTFPARLGYAISKNVKKFEEEINAYNKEREKLCKELCEKDEKGNPALENDGTSYKLSKEAKEILSKELNELLDTDVEIEIHTVTEDILERCAGSDRYHIPSAREILILDFMITEAE